MTRNQAISKSVYEKTVNIVSIIATEFSRKAKEKLTFVIWSGTSQCGQAANNMLRMKNGLQHSTNVKKTSPKTWNFEGKFRAGKI